MQKKYKRKQTILHISPYCTSSHHPLTKCRKIQGLWWSHHPQKTIHWSRHQPHKINISGTSYNTSLANDSYIFSPVMQVPPLLQAHFLTQPPKCHTRNFSIIGHSNGLHNHENTCRRETNIWAIYWHRSRPVPHSTTTVYPQPRFRTRGHHTNISMAWSPWRTSVYISIMS